MSDELFAKRFPEKVGHVGTHYPECYKAHPSCAWRVGYEDGRREVIPNGNNPHRDPASTQKDTER